MNAPHTCNNINIALNVKALALTVNNYDYAIISRIKYPINMIDRFCFGSKGANTM